MLIREAIEADIPEILKLGSRSLLEGPYKDQIKGNPEHAAKLALSILTKGKGRILLSTLDDTITGLLAFILFDHYFSGELTAGEVMWYVIPEARPGGIALKLLWHAEALAKSLGALRMQFTAPTVQVGNIYKRFGYHQIEVSYQKEL